MVNETELIVHVTMMMGLDIVGPKRMPMQLARFASTDPIVGPSGSVFVGQAEAMDGSSAHRRWSVNIETLTARVDDFLRQLPCRQGCFTG